MPCYNPITGYRSAHLNENSRRPIVWNEKHSDGSGPLLLPCGRCTGCRIDYSRTWALRCYHEAQMHDANAFVTLTYDEKHIPADRSINKTELQDFFKKLRYEVNEIYGCTELQSTKTSRQRMVPNRPIRYFACGEYGTKNNRPHYHALIFGYDFPDKTLYSEKDGTLLFRSKLLEHCWTKGFSTIGQVTFESAAYVARYTMKKRKGPADQKDKNGKTNKQHYELLDPETGEIHDLEPEFCVMSRRPGIGKAWYDTYKGDLEKDFLTLADGTKHRIPRYYDTLSEAEDETKTLLRKEKRKEKIKPEDNTFARLRVRETVKQAQLNQLKRGFENET